MNSMDISGTITFCTVVVCIAAVKIVRIIRNQEAPRCSCKEDQ